MTSHMATAMFDIVCSVTGDTKHLYIMDVSSVKLDISLTDVLMLPRYVRVVFIMSINLDTRSGYKQATYPVG